MPRKSSTIAKLWDLAQELTETINKVKDETNSYVEDAERYRELKPMLDKIANRPGKPATGQDTTDPSTIGQNTTDPATTGQKPKTKKRNSRKNQADSVQDQNLAQPDSNGQR